MKFNELAKLVEQVIHQQSVLYEAGKEDQEKEFVDKVNAAVKKNGPITIEFENDYILEEVTKAEKVEGKNKFGDEPYTDVVIHFKNAGALNISMKEKKGSPSDFGAGASGITNAYPGVMRELTKQARDYLLKAGYKKGDWWTSDAQAILTFARNAIRKTLNPNDQDWYKKKIVLVAWDAEDPFQHFPLASWKSYIDKATGQPDPTALKSGFTLEDVDGGKGLPDAFGASVIEDPMSFTQLKGDTIYIHDNAQPVDGDWSGPKAGDTFFKINKNCIYKMFRGTKDLGGPVDYVYKGAKKVQLRKIRGVASYYKVNANILDYKDYKELDNFYVRFRRRSGDMPFDPESKNEDDEYTIWGSGKISGEGAAGRPVVAHFNTPPSNYVGDISCVGKMATSTPRPLRKATKKKAPPKKKKKANEHKEKKDLTKQNITYKMLVETIEEEMRLMETANTLGADVNEILMGYYAGGGNWNIYGDQRDDVIQGLEQRKAQISPEEYADQDGRAKAQAEASLEWAAANGFDGKLVRTWWTARPGVLARAVETDVDSKKNPTDTLYKFSSDAFLGVSAKSTKGKGEIGFKNPGIGSLGKALGVDLVGVAKPMLLKVSEKLDWGDAKTFAAKKQYLKDIGAYPMPKGSRTPTPAGQPYYSAGHEVLAVSRDALMQAYLSMPIEDLKEHFLDGWIDAKDRYPYYIKVTGHGKNGNYTASVMDPLNNDKLKKISSEHIELEEVGLSSIGVWAGEGADATKLFKIRFKWESSPLTSGLKLSGEKF